MLPRLRQQTVITTSMPFDERPDGMESRLDRALLATWGTISRPMWSALQRRRLAHFVNGVERAEKDIAALSEVAFRAAADELRQRRTAADEKTQVRAFALAREAAKRHRGLRHFPVQLLGGAVMMRGALAEMQTGEGKTLTALLPAVAAALAGRPVHIVTVNDYLARRDATDMAPVYRALGISVGLVEHGQSRQVRQRAYASDITYCTNKELVFDYLRDRLALGRRRTRACHRLDQMLRAEAILPRAGELVLRGLHFAIVDEADGLLIDEARTPLILSGLQQETGGDNELYPVALEIAGRLEQGADFELSVGERSARLTERGAQTVAKASAGLDGIWGIRRAREETIRQALCALNYFHRDVQYIIADGKVQIVDEYTGRVMPDRSWEHGMHQLIEAKEGCAITQRKGTLDKITYQQFFRRYRHLCGMTGTAVEVAGELNAVYGLRVIRIPTNRRSARRDGGRRFFLSTEQKWQAVIEASAVAIADGRAVLIGTRSVEASEQVSALLTRAGHRHVVLNARQDGQEAAIVSGAGQPGCITVATNMAGRGTDIALHANVLANGGLHVILTEYHESRRIDRQLFGRAGRQGDPGSHEAIVALDDELFRRFCGAGLMSSLKWLSLGSAISPALLGSLLKACAQTAAETVHARARRAALADGRRFDEALGFAGRV
jgi:preprotein translocase subunit SecA